jgi:aminoglycoside/choline kinase family phosphotransferase
MPDRARLIAEFLSHAGWQGARREALAGDASVRRYDRLIRDGETAVLMDAPPPHVSVRAFHQVQCLLDRLGFSVPESYGIDEASGFMLLEDLGDLSFTQALAQGVEEVGLYRLATDLLIELHRSFAVEAHSGQDLPAYDDERLLEEVTRLIDWYLPALRGTATPEATREDFIRAWRQVLPAARRVPDSLVLRDFHVDNLMVLDGRKDLAACGLLDFQDAVIGPVTYDLVSLLEDARREVSPAVVKEIIERYLAAFPALDRDDFLASYRVLGAQRSTKIVGLFTRLCRRDGKPDYLKHIPRVWRLLEAGLADPALAPVKAWFDTEIPAAERVIPPKDPAG